MIVLEMMFGVLIIGGIAFYLGCAFFTSRFFYSNAALNQAMTTSHSAENSSFLNPATALSFSPVSILVPVCGLDAGAWENWSSLCNQSYTNYEVLFGVVDPQDPAIPILKELANKFPDKVRVFTGLQPRGINYKDSSLSYLLEEARYDWIIFVDSDIRVPLNYIEIVTTPLLDVKVGIVTCAFIGHTPQSLGAAIASFGRCFDFIPSLLIARAIDGGLKCAIGTTIATRRDALINYGGLHLNRIGSDYNIGKRASAAGYVVELSRYVLESDTGTEGIGDVYQRELRWARTIRFNRGAQYYSMIFCHATVLCLPLLLISHFASWAIALTLVCFLVRYIQILISIRSMAAPNLIRWLWAVPLRDLLSFVVWVMGSYGQNVYWRGRRLRVHSDGLITQSES
ncbi:glycosyltransferase [Phormidium sp. CLA17]|uniref:glycosyltransferase n=1 Tax=Leptolyngbya sp. Cla-17 TaxID=2803751 RepID=UPI001492BBE0|nr:glycosyltransferase [Leptolyngbya sp. Cla-17]MBM0741897.1 glycosyltransferase [Leptolyngbya sp. Cla-17]